MDTPELSQSIPDILTRYIDGFQPQQVLAPMEGIGGAWGDRAGRALLVLNVISGEPPELRITAGLTIDVPYSREVAEYVNRLNYKTLVFGRIFLIGEVPFMGFENESGPCGIVMQEIVFGDGLSWDFTPSIQSLIRTITTVGGQSDRLTGDLLERFGGRPFTDSEATILTLH
jgi:hypothetical protein